MMPSTAAALPSQHRHPWTLQKALLPPVAEMQKPCQLPLLQHHLGSRYRPHWCVLSTAVLHLLPSQTGQLVETPEGQRAAKPEGADETYAGRARTYQADHSRRLPLHTACTAADPLLICGAIGRPDDGQV